MRGSILLAAAVVAIAGTAGAKEAARPKALEQRPEAFEALVRCRGIAEESARLKCYDAAAAALVSAAERHDLVVVDRKQIRETKRTLFGLEIPSLNIFGGGDNEGEEIKAIDGVVANAYQAGYGRWVVKLEDGSTWVQTDNNTVALRPKPGTKVHISRGALGSYMIEFGKQPAIKAKRQL